MKKLLTILILLLSVFVLSACDSDGDDYFDSGRKDEENKEEENEEETDPIQLTISELAVYDGKGDNHGYIAVDGVIYDVTDEWSNGEHNGLMAGTDVTNDIANAPHGDSVLEDLEIVGEIIEDTQVGPTEYTLTELAMYDGKDGNLAYVAVNGIIYDVTDEWNNGEHNGQSAGTDISDFINSAPHGENVLNNLEEVGILVTE